MRRGLAAFVRIGLTLHVLKSALAAGLAWYVAPFLTHNHYPYFAALGAILTVQVTVADSIQKGVQRVVGIIGGVVVSLVVGHWLALSPFAVGLVVLIGMAVSTGLRLNPQITSQVAVSSLLVLAFGRTPGYALGRIVDTAIGCAIAVVINSLVVPPNPIHEAEDQILNLGRDAETVLEHLAVAYQEQSLRPVDLPYVQALVDQTEKTYRTVELVRQSLRFSPFLRGRRSRFVQLAQTISRMEHITVQIRGIARGLVDLGRDLPPSPNLIAAFQATAPCIALFANAMVDGKQTRSTEGPNDSAAAAARLYEAVQAARARQQVCLMDLQRVESPAVMRDVGGILTDLNRILREVSGEALVLTGKEFTLGEEGR
ncbi:MAG: FUSC family protein [Alicyclobacillus sp.]|nr:FUSC family protein [Alicyclobacillus sp.]